MYLHVSVLMFVLALASPSDAGFAPHRSVAGVTERLHKFALRHTAGLARDLRIIFHRDLPVEDTKQQQLSVPTSSHRVYCTRPDNPLGVPNSTSPATSSSQSSSGGGGSTTPATGTSSSSGAAPTATSQYQLQESHSGSNFFSGWTFFTASDPTNGIVQYLDQPTAQSNNLISINSAGNAVMSVETTPVVSNTRKSVRITTNNTFTGGLFVLDAVHMPTGCGTWPAFWTNGPNWPAGGEIDIVEGVGDYTNNQATIHTNPGCTVPSTNISISGTFIDGTNCAAAQTGNQGCGVRSNSTSSFGAAFNDIGGGVYAMLWDDDGIAVYFFPRSSIPSDLTAGAPQPTQWGLPMALWPSTDCNTSEFFYNHGVIFDTTLCGDWAGSVWTSSGIPGQETSCATRTNTATCQQYVLNNGASFDQAYWEVSSVKIYQITRTP